MLLKVAIPGKDVLRLSKTVTYYIYNINYDYVVEVAEFGTPISQRIIQIDFNMKKHFLNLFGYDFYANKIIFSVIREAKEAAKPVELMMHIFSVNQLWYDRCRGQQSTPGQHTGNKQDHYGGLEDLIIQSNDTWINFISGLSERDFEAPVTYQNSKGMVFQNSLRDILAQVINHGTHHRAQIGQHLKLGGLEALPNTDYINFVRLQSM